MIPGHLRRDELADAAGDDRRVRRAPRGALDLPDSGFVRIASAQRRDAMGVDIMRGLVLTRVGEGERAGRSAHGAQRVVRRASPTSSTCGSRACRRRRSTACGRDARPPTRRRKPHLSSATSERRSRSAPDSPGRARRRALARHRPRLRSADGARAPPVPDRAAARRRDRPRRRGPRGRLLHGALSSTSDVTPTRTSRRSGSATTSRSKSEEVRPRASILPAARRHAPHGRRRAAHRCTASAPGSRSPCRVTRSSTG